MYVRKTEPDYKQPWSIIYTCEQPLNNLHILSTTMCTKLYQTLATFSSTSLAIRQALEYMPVNNMLATKCLQQPSHYSISERFTCVITTCTNCCFCFLFFCSVSSNQNHYRNQERMALSKNQNTETQCPFCPKLKQTTLPWPLTCC